MRIVSKLFWAFLQHISAPSEKEIRERLLALLLVFMIWAPAYAIGTPADYKRQSQALRDEALRFEVAGFLQEVEDHLVVKDGKASAKFTMEKGRYSFDALTRGRILLEVNGWVCIIWQATYEGPVSVTVTER